MALEIPEGTVRSELHDFRIETFAEGLDPLPYSISPLPDGRFLVTVHRETLITDLARIRDVEVGADGLVYLLLEHASGGRIVRLAPAAAG